MEFYISKTPLVIRDAAGKIVDSRMVTVHPDGAIELGEPLTLSNGEFTLSLGEWPIDAITPSP